MNFKLYTLLLACFFVLSQSFAQRGKDLSYTVTSANTIVNTYTSVTADATSGSTSISVASNVLNGALFTTNLGPGDLVMIIQMQGAILNIDWWNGQFVNGSTSIPGYPGGASNAVGELFGSVLYENNSGNYELREVASVSGLGTINFTCGLQYDYTATGHAQVVRVPRYTNLTVGANNSIVPTTWNGTTGGIVSIEVSGNLILNANSSIDASGKGFRGGVAEGTSNIGTSTQHTDGPGNGSTYLGSPTMSQGGRKGEGIAGYVPEYITVPIYSPFGRGAMGNAGGGGGYQNAGGGGGSNIGTGARTGKGIPTPGYAAVWNLEVPGLGSMVSPGGGRGGYSIAVTQNDPTTLGPNRTAWGGDARKENGGYGGHALPYNANRIYFGGGGGSGGQDSGQGGSGGSGGGIVFLTVYGTVSGSGTIRSNGQNGINSNPLNEATPGGFSAAKKGNDGAGGAGGGGYVYVKSMAALPSTITLQANGGKGGDQDLRLGGFAANEIAGPGAGGAGGGIAFTSGTPINTVTGGTSGQALKNGVINNWLTSFPSNGATNGGSGLSSLPAAIFNITATPATICGSQTASLSASVTGTQPAGSTLTWYTTQFGSTVAGVGTTFTTPVLSVTTTYYVGLCPGTFRVPVTVTVGQNPLISGTVSITNATCLTQGSISGLSASGGVAPLTYSWNGVSSPNANLASASAGSYTLTVTDANGCFSQSGPYVVNGVGGPTITGTASVTNSTCTVQGSISGLSASGTATPLTYAWNGTSSPSTNLTSAAAGSYTLVVTDDNGCTASSGPYTISTTAGPTVSGTATIVDATCLAGGTINGLSASGGLAPYSYTWNGVTSPSANLSSSPAGSYTLVITDNNGCTVNSGPHTIGTTAGPTVSGTVNITDATCTANGNISGLSASGGATPYTYAWNGTSSPSANLASGAAGSYTLVITDNNGCAASSGPHTIGTTPGPTIGGTAVVSNATCITGGGITGLTVSGGLAPYTYAWNAVVTPSTNLSNASAGSYILTVVDNNGCSVQSASYTINLAGAPVLNTTNVVVSNENCGNANGSISGITISGGTAPFNYSWNGGPNSALNQTGLVANSYSLEVTDGNGCVVNAGPYTITNTPAPIVNTSGISIVNANCSGSLGAINGITVIGNNLLYSWNNGGGTSLHPSNLPIGDYSFTVTSQSTNCSTTVGPFTIGYNPEPVISTVNMVVTDENCNGTLGTITGITASGAGALSYSWTNTSQTTSQITGLTQGTYTLTVLDSATTCTTTSVPINVGYIGGPTADFSYSPQDPLLNDLVSFTDQSTGGVVAWAWSIDTNSYLTPNADYSAVTEGNIFAVLTVMDANGCVDSASVVLEIKGDLVIPNILTMNGDGVNDLFEIKGLRPNTTVLILNRWGEEVFSSSNYQNDWKGNDKSGLSLEDGVYFYRVKQQNTQWMDGFIHLVRN